MSIPTPEMTKDYDIVVWIDEDGDVVFAGFTPAAKAFIDAMYPEFTRFDTLVVEGTPEEFAETICPTLRIGCVQFGTNKVFKLAPGALH